MTALLWVFGVLATAALSEELLGWIDPLCRLVLRRGARRLPFEWQGRYAEEWEAELHALPGGPVTKILWTIRTRTGVCAIASARIQTIVASQVADYEPDEMVRRGLPAKPTRNGGVAALINRGLEEAAADEVERVWLRTLFRMMRGYACRDDRRSAIWPIDSWAGEKSRVDGALRPVGTDSTRVELSTDILRVLTTAEHVAGRRWVSDVLLRR